MAARAEFGGSAQVRRPSPLFASDARLVAAVRRGEHLAFERLYERHSDELLSYCRHTLGSLHDAEEAVQATFASAHRALLADDRTIELRPWLYAIARNACLSMIRRRRVVGDLDTLPPPEDPLAHLERQEALRQLLGTVLDLPQRQRDALVMAELDGLRHREISEIMGVRPEQVKAYVHQARVNLHAEREARDTDCETIRQQLASARGAALLKGNLRRHLRSCASCRAHAQALSANRGRMRALLPLPALLVLRRRALGAWLGRRGAAVPSGSGSSLASPLVELGGGGGAALAAKVLAGIALLGASATAGTDLLVTGIPHRAQAALQTTAQAGAQRAAALTLAAARVSATSGHGATALSLAQAGLARGRTPSDGHDPRAAAPRVPTGGAATVTVPAGSHPKSERGLGNGEGAKGSEVHGKSELPHGKSELPHGKSEAPHGKAGAPPGKIGAPPGKSEAPHGKAGAPPGKTGAPPGRSGAPPGKTGAPPGKSGAPPGKSEAPHVNAAAPPGKSEAPPGKTGSPPAKSETPHGKPENPSPGKSEQAHGKGAEAP